MSLRCLMCKEFQSYSHDTSDAPVKVEEGVVFRSWGQWGSKVFDKIDGRRLEFIVCDKCLVKNKRNLLYFGPARVIKAEEWDPE